MNVQRLFFDPALTGLPGALDLETLSPRLAALLGEDNSRRVVAVDVLKHKPGRRCALAYTLQGPGGSRRVFAKTFRNDRGSAIHVNMSRLHASVPARELRLPRPLGYLTDLKLLVTEYVEGAPLAPELYAGGSLEPARRMAAAAAVLHGCGAAFARRWTPRDEIRNTADWILGLSGRTWGASDRAAALLRALEGHAAAVGAAPETPVHRDFYPDQFWDRDGETVLLDLDDARSGDPALDLGNFLAHLTLRPVQFPATARGCESARGVFLEEYLRRSDGPRSDQRLLERVRFYEASTLLRLSGVYGARDRWADTVPPRLLDACEAILDTGGIR